MRKVCKVGRGIALRAILISHARFPLILTILLWRKQFIVAVCTSCNCTLHWHFRICACLICNSKTLVPNLNVFLQPRNLDFTN